jgi:hypothetical protein
VRAPTVEEIRVATQALEEKNTLKLHPPLECTADVSEAVVVCVINEVCIKTVTCCKCGSVFRFLPSEHGVKMTAPLYICTRDKQHAVVLFLASEGMKGAEIHQQLALKYGQNCLP